MEFSVIENSELELIKELQPEGWPDITEPIQFYIDHDFCKPIKIVIDQKIAGIGAYIIFNETAWLAHIIVKKEHRNMGIGGKIVKFLLDELEVKGVPSVLLIATDLGEPVYRKLGFRKVSDYLNFKKVNSFSSSNISEKVKSYHSNNFFELLQLDQKITAENREKLLQQNLNEKTLLYIENNKIEGYYIPELGEGPIYAITNTSGIELMKIKYSQKEKAVIPAENQAGIDFLLKNGFEPDGIKGRRMILGKDINWLPTCFYSRISGNFG